MIIHPTSSKTALVTGVTGQDGALLSEFLLDKGYRVIGMRPYTACDDTARLSSCVDHPQFILTHGDLTDSGSLYKLLAQYRPDEIYNLAAMSHVGASFKTPEATADINGLGTLRLLEAIIALDMESSVRLYQASSSEMYGNAPAPQSELTPFAPCSPYASAKVFAYWSVKNYRDNYGLHASNGILFNHESPVRGAEFVTRKIAMAVAAIAAGKQDVLWLGNLDAKRDWGHAMDYVRGMWMMLQQPCAGDYVLASGVSHSVRDFADRAFACAGIILRWEGSGVDECAFDIATGRKVVRIDPAFLRPSDINELRGDASRARDVLGWRAEYDFDALVVDMVRAELDKFGLAVCDDRKEIAEHVRA